MLKNFRKYSSPPIDQAPIIPAFNLCTYLLTVSHQRSIRAVELRLLVRSDAIRY